METETKDKPVEVRPDQILKYFRFEHLPEGPLRSASQPFCEMAKQVAEILPQGPERTTCLRKLLEAKDCAVRAAL
jgi:hypothetical protein